MCNYYENNNYLGNIQGHKNWTEITFLHPSQSQEIRLINPIEIYLFFKSKIHSTFKLLAGYTYRESQIIVGTEVENVVFAPLNVNTWSLFGCDDSLPFPCPRLLNSIQLFMQACFDLSHGSCSCPPLKKNCPPYQKKKMLIPQIPVLPDS